MGHCMGYSVATLPQQMPANTGHWSNAATEMTHRFQRRPSICLALGHCLVFFWNDSGAQIYSRHFPVGTEHLCSISAMFVQRRRRWAGFV